MFRIPVRLLAVLGLLAMCPPLPVVPGIAPPDTSPRGASYAQWSARWWRWFMQHPLAGHPSVDDPSFNVASGQSGKVWFLASPVAFGTATPPALTRTITIRPGIALFVGLLNGEFSSLEGAATEMEQRSIANFQADRIVNVAATFDGHAVDDILDFRSESPQFTFTAPTPWIFGPTGGAGTAVADGYYLYLEPMSVGQHVLHFSGGFHFEAGVFGPEPFDISADQTYVINVAP
jgi:hypothetical protein